MDHVILANRFRRVEVVYTDGDVFFFVINGFFRED